MSTKEIKEIKLYICPETGKKCRSKAEAERSAADAIKKKQEFKLAQEQQKLVEQSNLEKKDYIRLNATNISDIPNLIKEKAKEFWGIDCDVKINVNFGNVSNSHGAPLTKKTNSSGEDKNYPAYFLGWSGRITGTISNLKNSPNGSSSIKDTLFNNYGTYRGFRGFHTSSGCPGSIELKENCPMDIGFYFFLEDFPKLAESYELFKVEYGKVVKYREDLENRDVSSEGYSESRPDVIKLQKEIQELENQIIALKIQHRKQYVIDNPIVEPIIDPRLENLKRLFKRYNGYGEFESRY